METNWTDNRETYEKILNHYYSGKCKQRQYHYYFIRFGQMERMILPSTGRDSELWALSDIVSGDVNFYHHW